VIQLHAQFRLAITGTPIENHIMELWSHFRFLMPDLLGEEASFASEVQAGGSDPRFFQRIKRKIHPFLLRRKKEEVAKDLPDKVEQVVWIEMESQQRRIYEDFLAGVRGNLIKKVESDGISKHRMEILEAILRLRQICCHPLLVSNPFDEECQESAKMTALLQDVETVVGEGKKLLIYSQFTSMLGLIAKQLRDNGWRYVYMDGTTIDREKVVLEFQENSAIPIFLMSLKAGGIGLNLTAADYVFLYDPWWNVAVENQAIDRAHRIGRKDTVVAKRYVIVESIEEKMMKLKVEKDSLAANLLDEQGGGLTLSAEDLLFLLEEK
jgi:SNF2 family DNA or RNA helicase